MKNEKLRFSKRLFDALVNQRTRIKIDIIK